MTYQQTLDYLYNVAPMFQSIGAGAYKEGLTNIKILDEHFNHPHRLFRTIHVAGTNGKGSVSHTLAAILQKAGLRVGLYTSPHLKDFRERIRVNGTMISQQRVVDFVEQERAFFEPLAPSFFELTTSLAFLYFAEQQVDVAVIEVGLGGRLDCTNIIQPDLSIITNISFDHTQFLGNTLSQIASEKAGIIKAGVPIVIGETCAQDVRTVFINTAQQLGSPIRFADEEPWVVNSEFNTDGSQTYALAAGSRLHGELAGIYQRNNTSTILCAIDALMQQDYYYRCLTSHPTALRDGFDNVVSLTGLQGRWQRLRQQPLTICDAAHNVAGMSAVVEQLMLMPQTTIHFIIGMVNDKDIEGVVRKLKPLTEKKELHFHITQPSCHRALPYQQLQSIIAKELELPSSTLLCYNNVKDAYMDAAHTSQTSDLIIIAGSCYLIADSLEMISNN